MWGCHKSLARPASKEIAPAWTGRGKSINEFQVRRRLDAFRRGWRFSNVFFRDFHSQAAESGGDPEHAGFDFTKERIGNLVEYPRVSLFCITCCDDDRFTPGPGIVLRPV